MRFILALAIAFALLLAACDSEEQENLPGPIEDMSASDIIERVAEEADKIDSIKVESTQTDTELESPFPDSGSGEPQTTKETRITTPEGHYSRYDWGAEESCAAGDEWCESSALLMDETLWYRGKEYIRVAPNEQWVDPETCQNSESCGAWFRDIAVVTVGTDSVDCDALRATPDPDATIDPAALEEMNRGALAIYSVDLDNLTDLELLGEDLTEGRSTFHITGTRSTELDGSFLGKDLEDLYEECAIPVPTLPPELAMFEDFMPDRIETKYDLWVDDDFHIVRMESKGRGLRGDRLLSRTDIEAKYSLFNEAELPGPLPD